MPPFGRRGSTGRCAYRNATRAPTCASPLDPICPRCLSAPYQWAALSGRGTVQTFIRFQRAYDPSWEDRVPYVVALIQLDEGPVMISNVVGEGALDVIVDDAVEVVYELTSANAALPQFRLTKGS